MSLKKFTVRFFLAALVILLSLGQAGQASAGVNSWTGIGPAVTHVFTLAIDPQPPYPLYAGTSAGVFKTSDGGAHWTTANTGLTDLYVYALAIEPDSSTTLYAGTEDGLFKTTNAGGTWTAVNDGLGIFTQIMALVIDPGNPYTLYAGTWGGGVFKTTNGGGHWSAVNTDLTETDIYSLAMDPGSPYTLYAGTDGGGVFKTTNGGGAWALINTNLTNGIIVSLAIDPQDSTTVYAGTWGGGVFKTASGGGIWTVVKTGLTNLFIKALAIDPGNPDTVYAGTLDSVFKSTNGGGTWTAFNTGMTHFAINTLITSPGNPAPLYAGTETHGTYVIGNPIFADVPASYWAASWIERLYNAGITGGCANGPLRYCPENPVTRAEMAKFLELGIHGSAYTPPAGTGLVFADVSLSYWADKWIEKLYADGVTSGCLTSPLRYCPDDAVTRAQMAKFLLLAKHGKTYTPPAVGAGTGFGDVAASYWAAAWIKQLAAEGITSGCGGGNYCPENSVTRAEMAKFLVLTFNLP